MNYTFNKYMRKFWFLEIYVLILSLQTTLMKVKVNLGIKNRTLPIIAYNKTSKLNQMFNITENLNSSCYVCTFTEKYYEDLEINQTNISMEVVNSSNIIKNPVLYTNHKNINSFFSLTKKNNTFYDLRIITQCQQESFQNNYINDEQFIKAKYSQIPTSKENVNNNDYYIFLNFTFEDNEQLYNFEYFKICKNENKFISIIPSIGLFTLAFLYLLASTYMQINLKIIKEFNEKTEISWWYGIFFILMASCVLLLIYYFSEYISNIFQGLLFFECFLTLFYPIKYFSKQLFHKYTKQIEKKPIICSLRIYDLSSYIISLGLVIFYFLTKYWFMNNIVAFGLCFFILSLIPFKSFFICFVFLFALFVYDTFWVFYSSKIFGGNVMLVAATTINIPATIEMVSFLSVNPITHCGLLGLGDIVLPGMIIKYCKKFDSLSMLNKGKGGYYSLSLILYIISISLAGIALHIFEHGQPVLFYISPIFIIGLLLKAMINKELSQFWKGSFSTNNNEHKTNQKNQDEQIKKEDKNENCANVELKEYKNIKNEEDENSSIN